MGHNSTGHYFFLETDSSKIGVRWECEQKSHQDPYIPRQGMYGVDIYVRAPDFLSNSERLGSRYRSAASRSSTTVNVLG